MSMRPTLNLKAPKEKDEKDAGEDGTAAEESWPPCHACFKHCMWAMLADHWNSYVRPPYHVHKASRRNVRIMNTIPSAGSCAGSFSHMYNPVMFSLSYDVLGFRAACSTFNVSGIFVARLVRFWTWVLVSCKAHLWQYRAVSFFCVEEIASLFRIHYMILFHNACMCGMGSVTQLFHTSPRSFWKKNGLSRSGYKESLQKFLHRQSWRQVSGEFEGRLDKRVLL